MNTKTKNTPVAPGAMTPAELTRRTIDRVLWMLTATATTATATAIFLYLLFL